MTNREAIAAEIEPYSLSEDGLDKLFIDAAAHFGVTAYVDDDYNPATMLRPVALAAMRCLAKMRVLQREQVDVINNTYDTTKIDKAISSIAESAGLDPSLVGNEGDNYGLTAVKCW